MRAKLWLSHLGKKHNHYYFYLSMSSNQMKPCNFFLIMKFDKILFCSPLVFLSMKQFYHCFSFVIQLLASSSEILGWLVIWEQSFVHAVAHISCLPTCCSLFCHLCYFWQVESQAYYILDEILIAGELQESSKKTVARLIAAQVWLFYSFIMQYSFIGIYSWISILFVCRILWWSRPRNKLVL